jgi:hypothetical protein
MAVEAAQPLVGKMGESTTCFQYSNSTVLRNQSCPNIGSFARHQMYSKTYILNPLYAISGLDLLNILAIKLSEPKRSVKHSLLSEHLCQ